MRMRSLEQSLTPSGVPISMGAVPVTHLPPRGAVPVTHPLIITLERGASLSFYVSGASTMTQVSFTWTKRMVPYCFVIIQLYIKVVELGVVQGCACDDNSHTTKL